MFKKLLTGAERSEIKSLVENKKVFLTLCHRNPNAPRHELYSFFFFTSRHVERRRNSSLGLLNLVPRSSHSSGKNHLVNPFQRNFAYIMDCSLFIYFYFREIFVQVIF